MIDSLQSAAPEILNHLKDLCENTAPTCWLTGAWHHIFYVASLLAAAITTGSIILIYRERLKEKVSKGCQKHIMQDLVRHFWINNIILEIVKMKMEAMGYSEVYPEESTFRRFCVLPGDLDFGKLSIKSRYYDRIHDIELQLRNYNITAEMAADHFRNPALDREVKERDIDELVRRSVSLTENLLKIGNEFGLRMNNTHNIVTGSLHNEEIRRAESEGRMADIPLCGRKIARMAFYDEQNLREFNDRAIRCNFGRICMIEFKTGRIRPYPAGAGPK